MNTEKIKIKLVNAERRGLVTGLLLAKDMIKNGRSVEEVEQLVKDILKIHDTAETCK